MVRQLLIILLAVYIGFCVLDTDFILNECMKSNSELDKNLEDQKLSSEEIFKKELCNNLTNHQTYDVVEKTIGHENIIEMEKIRTYESYKNTLINDNSYYFVNDLISSYPLIDSPDSKIMNIGSEYSSLKKLDDRPIMHLIDPYIPDLSRGLLDYTHHPGNYGFHEGGLGTRFIECASNKTNKIEIFNINNSSPCAKYLDYVPSPNISPIDASLNIRINISRAIDANDPISTQVQINNAKSIFSGYIKDFLLQNMDNTHVSREDSFQNPDHASYSAPKIEKKD